MAKKKIAKEKQRAVCYLDLNTPGFWGFQDISLPQIRQQVIRHAGKDIPMKDIFVMLEFCNYDDGEIQNVYLVAEYLK